MQPTYLFARMLVRHVELRIMVSPLCSLLFILPCILLPPSVRAFTCFDDSKNPVDWFVAIKLPTLEAKEGVDLEKKYFLFTSTLKAWRESTHDIDSKGGAIYDTISQAYNLKDKNKTLTLIYNDEIPETHSSSFTYGHLKGVVAFEAGNQGFWMIDSVPKFPGPSGFSYPDSGMRYGQHFICVTFSADWIPVIAKQLAYARPDTYGANLPSWMATKYPDLALLVHHKKPKVSGVISVAKLKSSKGQLFIHFSKTATFHKDLYDSLVAPSLKASLYMEGWINGNGSLPSECNLKYRVYNIKEVQLQDYSWTTTKDHSKWAVSADKTKQWVCLGDINRQVSQAKRGGGTLCLMDSKLWEAFSALVVKYDHCDTVDRAHGLHFDRF